MRGCSNNLVVTIRCEWDADMGPGHISHAVEPGGLPPLTHEQLAELAALAKRPDDQIETSDAPVLPPEAWADAVRGRFYRPRKTSTTVRIDADVLAWLRSQGRGYQTRLNAILRREMLAASKPR